MSVLNGQPITLASTRDELATMLQRLVTGHQDPLLRRLARSCAGIGMDDDDVDAAVRDVLTGASNAGDPFKTLSVDDLANLAPVDFLIDGMLPASGFSVLFGPSGVGKSFLALDWALCIATGLAWYGRETRGGAVLYIAAEGSSGLGRRVQAWQNARRQPTVGRIRFLPEAVNFLDAGHVERAKRTIAELPEPPVLVVVDTMARSMIGGDENAARDVGMFIADVDELCKASGAARLIVHHTGKNGVDERGSSALRGAADLHGFPEARRRRQPVPRVRQEQGHRAVRALGAAPRTGRRIVPAEGWQ